MNSLFTLGKNLIQNVTIAPLFKRMAKETSILDKRYDKFLNQIEREIEYDNQHAPPRMQEVCNLFNLCLRESRRK